VTQGASDAERFNAVAVVAQGRLDSDDSVKLQKGHRSGRTRKADASVLNACYHRGWQGFRIDFQSDRQRGRRIDRTDHLLHAQGVSPFRLVPEGIEPKRLLARCHQSRLRLPGTIVAATMATAGS